MTDKSRLKAISREACVIGVGDTDYAVDWARSRAGVAMPDSYGYALTAFSRALADAGIAKSDIDGLVVGPTLAVQRTGEVLGLDVSWSAQGDAAQSVFAAVSALVCGYATCVALVYGNDQKSAKFPYGGPASDGQKFMSYVYFEPWGLTSQGALYALMTRRYMAEHGLTPEGLASVAVGQREFAGLNPNAVMRGGLTVDDYLASRFIVEPLRLFDYTIINDGGVALILTTSDRVTKSMGGRAVPIAGLGRSELNFDATSLRPRLENYYHSAHRAAAADLYEMTGHGADGVDFVQVYDSFSCHVPFALSGFGFSDDDGIDSFLRCGATHPGGAVPTNTSGGHLSESYMQGWNHQVEAIRQLRHEAGARQVDQCQHGQYISDVAGNVLSIIYSRAGGGT